MLTNTEIKYLVIYLFFIEVLILFFIVVVITFKRIGFHYQHLSDEIASKKISGIITYCLLNEDYAEKLHSLAPYAFSTVLLTNVEAFDMRIKSDHWEHMKGEIATRYLLKKARKWTTSRSWENRNFAIRCLAIKAYPEDVPAILKLVEDKVFLVNSIASFVAVKLELKEGVAEVIQRMSEELGYARHYYNDALILGSSKVFKWIEEIALASDNPEVYRVCLEVLGSKTITLEQRVIDKGLNSSDSAMRNAAIKTLALNPQPFSEPILIQAITDKDPDVREDAAFGLQNFGSEGAIEKLTTALNDVSWKVRTQAAKTLKILGKTNILNKIDLVENERAYEAAKYAMLFG